MSKLKSKLVTVAVSTSTREKLRRIGRDRRWSLKVAVDAACDSLLREAKVVK